MTTRLLREGAAKIKHVAIAAAQGSHCRILLVCAMLAERWRVVGRMVDVEWVDVVEAIAEHVERLGKHETGIHARSRLTQVVPVTDHVQVQVGVMAAASAIVGYAGVDVVVAVECSVVSGGRIVEHSAQLHVVVDSAVLHQLGLHLDLAVSDSGYVRHAWMGDHDLLHLHRHDAGMEQQHSWYHLDDADGCHDDGTVAAAVAVAVEVVVASLVPVSLPLVSMLMLSVIVVYLD